MSTNIAVSRRRSEDGAGTKLVGRFSITTGASILVARVRAHAPSSPSGHLAVDERRRVGGGGRSGVAGGSGSGVGGGIG